jgi:hypothetical protein
MLIRKIVFRLNYLGTVSSEDSDLTCMRAHERGADEKLLNNLLLPIAVKKTALFQ